MRRAQCFFLTAISLFAATALDAGPNLHRDGTAQTDWLHFRFDDNHTGFQPTETTLGTSNIRNAGLLWKAFLGESERSLVNYSSPAVVNGVVYIGTTDGRLWAYPADGCGQDECDTPLWTSPSFGQIMDSPAVANGVVYIGSQTDDNDASGKLNAFAADGCGQAVCAPLWQGVTGTQSILQSSPAVSGGFVFIAAFDGKLYAFNADGCGKKKCKPVWTAQTGDHIESTPTVSKGIVYVGSNDGKLYAFKAAGCGKKVCTPKWTGDLGGTIFESTPAVAKGLVYINAQHKLAAFDAKGCGAETCEPVWTAEEDQDFFSGSPTIAYGRVYQPLESGVAVYKAKGCGALVCDKQFLLFGTGMQDGVESSPTVANGVVYAGRNSGEVLAWNAQKCGQFVCNELWKGFTDDPIVSSSPTVVNGKIYVGSAQGGGGGTIAWLYVYGLQN